MQVGELGQLIRRTLRARGLLDILAELPLLDLRVPHLVLVHLAAAGDQVHQDPDQREKQDEDEPQGLGPAGQVMAAEQFDEAADLLRHVRPPRADPPE